ncbi:MAG: 3-hydroxyacyl-CoA dehydrogenase NAD-binding domain-containing protein [Promethearchaeota archaeon]
MHNDLENDSSSLNVSETAVIGAGDMGHGIAEICAIAGYEVNLYDIKQIFLDNALQRIKDSLKKLARKKKIQKENLNEILSKIISTLDISKAVENADIIFEAVPENIDIKKNVFQSINKFAKQGAIIASNTSYIKIGELAQYTTRPKFVIGMHFFNPVVIMKSLEVIRTKKNLNWVIDKAVKIGKKLGKIPIVVNDSPGFVVNRVQITTQILLGRAVEMGEIMPNQIDATMRKMGMPMGAFEVMDFSGLDISVNGMEYMGSKLGEDYLPPKWMKDLVEKGLLGKKTGKGIYDWSQGRPKININDTTDKITPLDLLIVQINEAAKIIEEGVVDSFEKIDILIKNGTGNPMGIFPLLKSIGKEKIIERLLYFKNKLGLNVFEPCSYLKSIEIPKK